MKKRTGEVERQRQEAVTHLIQPNTRHITHNAKTPYSGLTLIGLNCDVV